MLHIYTGREDIDKQRWMFERIRRQDLAAGRKQTILLIVPDQFTLEMERSAFEYLNVPAFMNPVILSINRLAEKVFAETGKNSAHIDRYGKYMLLARLLYRNKDKLNLYRNLEGSTKFIEQLSEAIMSLKAHLKTPEELVSCAETVDSAGKNETLLSKKLDDLAALYKAYETFLADALPDVTDILLRFIEQIPKSSLIKTSVIWFYGFDYFSPLHLAQVSAMAAHAAEVNIVLTAADSRGFELTNNVVKTLMDAATIAEIVPVVIDADGRGIDCSYLPVDKKPHEIAHIETALFEQENLLYQNSQGASTLRFVAAPNYYAEAEEAAQTIMRLVQDEGFRYRDTLVICNDQEKRGPIIERIFDTYGIPVFMDKRHDAGFSPVLAYITALTEIVSRGFRAQDVLRWIESGLTDIFEEDAEELDNYIARYGLRGSAWKNPLVYDERFYDENTFGRLSATVKYINEMIGRFTKRFSQTKSALARTEGLRTFLVEDAHLPEKIEAYADRLEAAGFLDYAGRMRGFWNITLDIFMQIETTLGDTSTNIEEYATILRVGFSSVMMGILPALSDAVTIGTMQRTRTGRVKAMLALGANEGELPKYAEDDGLFDDSEREILEKHGFTAFRREGSLHDEEELAIYKNLSKPTRLLYISHTAFGADGKEKAAPSRIFNKLRAMFPEIPLEYAGVTKVSDSFVSRISTATRPVVNAKIDAERLRVLFPSALPATAIEKYSRCPFSFFINMGLRLREIRKYEVDGRGMGEVYHEILCRFGNIMNGKGGAPANANSAWNTASRADTDAILEKIFREMELGVANISKEGALLFDKNDPAAKYRLTRLEAIAKDICWALTKHTKNSGAETLSFEQRFGNNSEFGILSVGEEGASQIQIEGRIDRIDVMPNGEANVIDYKSGSEKWNEAEIKSGWQLQLMIYLKAIESKYNPSGVFYFKLGEQRIDLSKTNVSMSDEEIKDAITKKYTSDGAYAGDPESGNLQAGERALSKQEFAALRKETDMHLRKIAEALNSGDVSAVPKQSADGSKTACTYCSYRSICNYDAY